VFYPNGRKKRRSPLNIQCRKMTSSNLSRGSSGNSRVEKEGADQKKTAAFALLASAAAISEHERIKTYRVITQALQGQSQAQELQRAALAQARAT
jgi:hypothetical protein